MLEAEVIVRHVRALVQKNSLYGSVSCDDLDAVLDPADPEAGDLELETALQANAPDDNPVTKSAS